MLPNAGNACNYQGIPIGLHGEIMMLPWKYVIEMDTPENVIVVFNNLWITLPFQDR